MKFARYTMFTFILLVLAGCSETEQHFNKEPQKFTIMYLSELDFYNDFGDYYLSKHPEVEIEVLATGVLYQPRVDRVKLVEQFMVENNPDVVVLSMEEYNKFAHSGRLYSLDMLIQEDKEIGESMHPTILEWLRNKGNGEINGLSPFFAIPALYYNEDLFEQYGVNPPKDQMTWEEVFTLAKQFPIEDEVYGFSYLNGTDPYFLTMNIAKTLGISDLDPNHNNIIVINTDPWRNLLNMTADAVQSGVIYMEQFSNSTLSTGRSSELFGTGKVAMLYDSSFLLDDLINKRNMSAEDMPRWDVVTQPVNPASPNKTYNYSINQIFAISAESPNLEAAWNFLGFIHGEEFSNVRKRSLMGNIPTRKMSQSGSGYNQEAFYLLNFASDSETKDTATFNPGIEFGELIKNQFNAALIGEINIEDALTTVQELGGEILMKEQSTEGN